MPVYSLTDLNQHIRDTVEDTYPDAIWVQAEIAALNRNSLSGHAYMELVDGPAQRAKARAIAWKKTFELINGRFQVQTGTPLGAGMKVQFLVKIEFSLQFGLSLIVWDVDAAFTLGDLEVKRNETLKRLRTENLLDRNKNLPLPFPPQRLAILSSPTAAGLEDFEVHLLRSEFAFVTTLFPAPMQGVEQEPAVLKVLGQIDMRAEEFDVLVVLRGGGSKLDLQLFDQYELGKALATCRLPVLTGIGHERDESVCDRVAFRSFKTPTAVASWLLENMQQADKRVTEELDRISRRAQWKWQVQAERMDNAIRQIYRNSQNQLRFIHQACRTECQNIFRKTASRLSGMEKELDRREWRVKELNPLSVLGKGYARVYQEGKIRKSISALSPDKPVLIQLQDGKISARTYDLSRSHRRTESHQS